MIKGNKDILFAYLTDDKFYCLKIGEHNFTDRDLIDIVYSNWPELINRNKLENILDVEYYLTSKEGKELQRIGINPVQKLGDGSFFVSPGGGVNLKGESLKAIRQRCTVKKELSLWRIFLNSHI